MKALITAQTIGKRLAPLSNSIPKPIVPILNKPAIAYAIELLSSYGITDIVISLHDEVELIKSTIKSIKPRKTNITFAVVPKVNFGMPYLEKYFNGTFFILDPDIISNVDLNEMHDFHKTNYSQLSIALVKPQARNLTRAITSREGKLLRLDRSHNAKNYYSPIGIKIAEMEWFNWYSNKFFSGIPFEFENDPLWFDCPPFSKDFFDNAPYFKLADSARWFGYKSAAYGIDIGIPLRYLKAQRDILSDPNDLTSLRSYRQIKDKVWIGKNVNISKGARILGPTLIGANCTIKRNSVILPYSVLGENITISNNSEISASVLLDNCTIGSEVIIKNSLIPNNCIIESKIQLNNVVHLSSGQIVSFVEK